MDVTNDKNCSYSTATSSKKYLECERTLLAELYKERKDILLRKDRDLKTSMLKTQTWEEITEKYNESRIVQTQRSSAQLRKLWENMVRLTRESISKQKQQHQQQQQKQVADNDGVIVLDTPPCRSIFEEVAEILGHDDVNINVNGHGDVCDVRIHEMDDSSACASYGVATSMLRSPPHSAAPPPPSRPPPHQHPPPPIHITKQLLNKRIKRFRRPGFVIKKTDHNEEMLEMRRKEHEMIRAQHELTMTKLEWEVAYWRRKYESEFGD